MSAPFLGQVNIALALTGSTRIIDSSSRLRRVLKSFSTSLLCVCVCIFWSMHHRFHSPCTWYIADLQRISNFISAISILFCDRFRFILLLLFIAWAHHPRHWHLIYLSKLRYTALFILIVMDFHPRSSVIHWPSFVLFLFLFFFFGAWFLSRQHLSFILFLRKPTAWIIRLISFSFLCWSIHLHIANLTWHIFTLNSWDWSCISFTLIWIFPFFLYVLFLQVILLFCGSCALCTAFLIFWQQKL